MLKASFRSHRLPCGPMTNQARLNRGNGGCHRRAPDRCEFYRSKACREAARFDLRVYDAAPHSANLSNPNFQKTGRIQQLMKQLINLGFSQTTAVSRNQHSASSWKCFLHPLWLYSSPVICIRGIAIVGPLGTNSSPSEYGPKSTASGRSIAHACGHWNVGNQP